ncbi:MAG TPA: hypothetical protein VJP77_07330 [Planctomycetota bacterium]|nr:hypothetical protein [Planctomycetota bacterium]
MAAAARDTTPASRLALIGTVGVVITIVTVLLLQVLYYRGENAQFRSKVVEVPYHEAVEVLGAQRAELAGYGWVDREAGTVHVPIEDAMREVAERY